MTEQRSMAWVRSATPEELYTAYEAGQLNDALDQPNDNGKAAQ